ncbi:hypothetical protein PSP6_630024 [Paraburkholderia tropica]|nr:hypothetical protein PSP6_630024 [Paraburkholderia tropica]
MVIGSLNLVRDGMRERPFGNVAWRTVFADCAYRTILANKADVTHIRKDVRTTLDCASRASDVRHSGISALNAGHFVGRNNEAPEVVDYMGLPVHSWRSDPPPSFKCKTRTAIESCAQLKCEQSLSFAQF